MMKKNYNPFAVRLSRSMSEKGTFKSGEDRMQMSVKVTIA